MLNLMPRAKLTSAKDELQKILKHYISEEIVEELKENIPKSDSGNKTARLHQLLTDDDIGNPHLTVQINQVISRFQLSDEVKYMVTI